MQELPRGPGEPTRLPRYFRTVTTVIDSFLFVGKFPMFLKAEVRSRLTKTVDCAGGAL